MFTVLGCLDGLSCHGTARFANSFKKRHCGSLDRIRVCEPLTEPRWRRWRRASVVP